MAADGALDPDFQDAGRSDGAVVQDKLEVPSGADQTRLQDAGLIRGALQCAGHGRRAKVRVAGDANAATAQALDPVVAVPGFDVQSRAGRQALAIDAFGGRHQQSLLLIMTQSRGALSTCRPGS
jgi:hypothetical protein